MSRRGRGEGSIYQRADGRWAAAISIGYADGTRKRKTLYGRTRGAVHQQLAKALKDYQDGVAIGAPQQTVKVFLGRWLKDVATPRLRPRSAIWYAQILNDHVIPTLGRVPIDKVTPNQVQQLLVAKSQAGLSPRTVRHIRTILRTALSTAVRWRLVTWNVASLVDVPRAAKHEPTVLTPEEARAFLKAAGKHPLGPLFTVGLASGLRLGEVLGLGWADLDVVAKTLVIRRSLQRIAGKLQLVEPKSASSRRKLELPDVVLEALARHRARQRRDRLKAGEKWKATHLVFTSSIGTPIDERNVRRAFAAILTAAGLPRMRIHDLRHTCATLLLAQGVHPKVVMELLGHSQVTLTLDTYSHVLPTLQHEAIAGLNAILPGKKA